MSTSQRVQKLEEEKYGRIGPLKLQQKVCKVNTLKPIWKKLYGKWVECRLDSHSKVLNFLKTFKDLILRPNSIEEYLEVGWLLIMDSMSLEDIALFRIFTSFCVILAKLYF